MRRGGKEGLAAKRKRRKEKGNKMKKSLKTLLALAIVLVMVVAMLPVGAAAVTLDPQNGVFIKDAGTDFFNMDGESQNGNVVASIAWRWGSYVYFCLNCQKNVSVDVDEFKINGVTVGADNFWMLDEDTAIKLYDGADAAAPTLTRYAGDGHQPRIWIVGRILLSNSSLELTFENLHHAHGWEIAGVTIEAKLTVSHRYGDAAPILDFDQSAATLTAGEDKTVRPVPQGEYELVFYSVTINGQPVADLAAAGITDENGKLSFTVSDAMASGEVAIAYVYAIPAPTHTLTVHYQYADGTTAAATYSDTLAYNAPYSVASPVIEGYTPDTELVSGTMPDDNVTVTVTYTANNYTLTIYYKYEDGSEAAETYTGTVAYKAGYSVASPVIEDFHASQATVSGTMPAANVEVTVTYTKDPPKLHKLTVNYVYAEGGEAAETYSGEFAEGEEYSVASPVIEGCTPDAETVSGTMGTEDVEVTVTYKKDPPPTYTLTIRYQYANGDVARDEYSAELAEGEEYSVESPTIDGYTPNQAVVSGTMPGSPLELAVTYTANPGPSDDPTPSPEPTAAPEPSPEPSAEPETGPAPSPEPSAEPTDEPVEETIDEISDDEIPTYGEVPAEEETLASETAEVLYGSVPLTGDKSMPYVWAGLALLAAAGLAVVSVKPRRKEDK